MAVLYHGRYMAESLDVCSYRKKSDETYFRHRIEASAQYQDPSNIVQGLCVLLIVHVSSKQLGFSRHRGK